MSNRLPWGVVWAWVGLLAAVSVAADGPGAGSTASLRLFEGVFKDDRITLKLERDESLPQLAYKGSITQGSNNFPVRATAKDNKIEGSFRDKQGDTFAFSAVLEQETLTLATGGMTYKLAIQRPAANPLAQPGNPLAKPAEPMAANVQNVSLTEYSIHDPKLNMAAWAFVAPSDWIRQGEVRWTGHIAPSSITVLRIANPRGSEEFMLYPTLSFTTGDPNQAFGMPRSPYLDPANCIRRIIIPYGRPNAQQGKELGYVDMPHLAKQEAQRIAAQGLPPAQIKAGRLLVEYVLAGRPTLEMFYCITVAAQTPSGTMWSIDIAFSYRADKDKFYGVLPMFNHMAVCLRENSRWTAARLQRVRDMVNQRYPLIPATPANSGPSILDVSRSMSKNTDQFLANIDKIHTDRLNSGDKFTSTFRNTSTLMDPNSGEKFYNMPNTTDRTFRTNSGTIFGSNDPTYDPWVSGKISATELQRMP